MKLEHKKSLRIYLIVFVIWIISIITKLKFNGLIFGLDYGLYHPDGALYSTRAFDWSGYSESQSAKLVSDWYNNHALKFNLTTPGGLLYENHSLYREYSTRVLYPLLSVPFIKILGMPGMLIIPSLSLLILMLVVAKMGVALKKPILALIIILCLSSSTTVLRWMMANTTDALLAGIFSVAAYLLFKDLEGRYWYLVFGGLIVLTAVTRFSILFWFAIAFVMIWQKQKFRALFLTISSIFVVLPTLATHSGSSFVAVAGEKSFVEKLIIYPFYIAKITVYEFGQLFVLDKILFFMCISSIYFSVIHFGKLSSKYLLMIFSAGLLTGALNGNVGVNFRYQLPVLIFICWNLIDNLNFPGENNLKNKKNQTRLSDF